MGNENDEQKPDQEKPEQKEDSLATVAAASGSPEVSAAAARAIPYQGPVTPVPQIGAEPEQKKPGSFAKFGDVVRMAGSLSKLGISPASALPLVMGWHMLSGGGAAEPGASSQPMDERLGFPGSIPFDQATRSGPSPETPPMADRRSKAQKAIGGIEAQLGDVAAATEGGPAGGGIAGAFRVAKASASRQRQEREDHIKMATANAQMLHEQIAAHKLSEEMMQQSVQAGMASYQASIAMGGETIAAGKSGSELLEMMKQKDANGNRLIDTTTDGVFLAGRRQVGEDSNGVPRFDSIYNVVRQKPGTAGKKYPLSDEQVDFLNKYAFTHLEHGQELSFQDHYVLDQTAHGVLTQALAIEEAKTKLGEATEQRKIDEGSKQIMTNPAVMKAFGAIQKDTDKPGVDPFAFVRAYHWLQQHPELVKDGTLPDDWAPMFVKAYYGDQKKFDDAETRLGAIETKIQTAQNDYLNKVDEKLAVAPTPEVVTSISGELQRRLHDPATKPEEMPELRARLQQASDTVTAMETIKRREKEIDDAIKNGDPKEIARDLVANRVTRSELQTRGLTEAFIQDALKEAVILDSDYSYPRQEGWLNAAKQPQMAGFFGNVNSLLAEDGTVDQLMEAGKKISDHDWQILNKVQNWASLQSGQPGIAGYSGTVVAIADDYAKVMGGGIGSDKARELVLGLTNPNQSADQRKASVEAIRMAVRSQAEGRLGNNPFMWTMYGDLVPGAAEHRAEVQKRQQQRAAQGLGPDGKPKIEVTNAPTKKAPAWQRFPGAGQFRGMIGMVDAKGNPHYFRNEASLQTFLKSVAEQSKQLGIPLQGFPQVQ